MMKRKKWHDVVWDAALLVLWLVVAVLTITA